MTAETSNARGELRPGIDRLWDSQWVNIVNSPEVLEALRSRDYEGAVSIAVRMTEQKMAENFAAAPPPAAAEVRAPDVAMALHWIDRYAAGIDDECQIDLVADALGVTLPDDCAPEPSQQPGPKPEARGVVDETTKRDAQRWRNLTTHCKRDYIWYHVLTEDQKEGHESLESAVDALTEARNG